MSTDRRATSESTQLSTKVWVKPLLLLENALNFWGPLTNWKFEPSPRAHTHSLHTELAYHCIMGSCRIQYALSTLVFFVVVVVFFVCLFVSPRGFLQSTTWPHQSTARLLERATSHIKMTHPPCLFRLLPWENVNRSTTLIYCTWLMSSH